MATVSRRLHNKTKKVINQSTSKIWEHEIESQNLRTHTEVDQKMAIWGSKDSTRQFGYQPEAF